MAFAKVTSKVEADRFKRDIQVAYLNAKLGRAEKIPPLSKILAERKPPTVKQIFDRLKAAPTYTPAG